MTRREQRPGSSETAKQSPGSSKRATPRSIEESNPQVHRRERSPGSSKRTTSRFIEDSKAQVHRREQYSGSSKRAKPMFIAENKAYVHACSSLVPPTAEVLHRWPGSDTELDLYHSFDMSQFDVTVPRSRGLSRMHLRWSLCSFAFTRMPCESS